MMSRIKIQTGWDSYLVFRLAPCISSVTLWCQNTKKKKNGIIKPHSIYPWVQLGNIKPVVNDGWCYSILSLTFYLIRPPCWPFCLRQHVTASAWRVTRPGFVHLAVTQPGSCCLGNANMTAAPISTTSTPRPGPAEVHGHHYDTTHTHTAVVQGEWREALDP